MQSGAMIHRGRRLCYRYTVGKDLLDDWVIAQLSECTGLRDRSATDKGVRQRRGTRA
jgi:hypothetical protein